MALDAQDVVIVLGTDGSVLEVNTVEHVLGHLIDHLVIHATQQDIRAHHHGLNGLDHMVERSTDATDPADRLLRFFTISGELLELRIVTDWWTFALEPTGGQLPEGELEREVHAILEAGRPAVEARFAEMKLPPPELPPPGDWKRQVDTMRGWDDDRWPSHLRGWWHNCFVHGIC